MPSWDTSTCKLTSLNLTKSRKHWTDIIVAKILGIWLSAKLNQFESLPCEFLPHKFCWNSLILAGSHQCTLELEAFVKANQPRVFYSKRSELRKCVKKGSWAHLVCTFIIPDNYRGDLQIIIRDHSHIKMKVRNISKIVSAPRNQTAWSSIHQSCTSLATESSLTSVFTPWGISKAIEGRL